MTNEQVIGIVGMCRDLVALEERKLETMKKLVYAYSNEHLKQNKVKQTYDERNEMNAAIAMLMGKKQFTPNHGGFYHRRSWPTHLRISDLKPVRVRQMRFEDDLGDDYMAVRYLGSSKIECTINQKTLDEEYLALSDKEIE